MSRHYGPKIVEAGKQKKQDELRVGLTNIRGSWNS